MPANNGAPISDLPAATLPLAGTEDVPVVQDGVTKRAPSSAFGTSIDLPLAVDEGGTGLDTLAQGDLLYAGAVDTLTRLPKDTNATRYLSNTGASNNPAWAQVSLANGVTGTLPVTNGGTGLAAAAQGDLLYSSAADTLARLPKDTNATRYLSNTGASNNPAWAQVNLANGVTGSLPVANAGTGLTAYDQGDLIYASAANTLARLSKSTTASQYIANNEGFAILMRAGEGLAPEDIGFSDGTFNGAFGAITGEVDGQGVCRLYHQSAIEEFGLYFQTPLVPVDFIFSIVIETEVGVRTYLQSEATVTEVGGRRQYTWAEPDPLFLVGGSYTAVVYLEQETNNPVWRQVNLLNGVEGVLQAENGGTGHTAGGAIVYDALPEDEFALAPPRTWTLTLPDSYGYVPGLLKWKFFVRYANLDAANVPTLTIDLASNGGVSGLLNNILEVPPGVYNISFDCEFVLPAAGGGGGGVTGVMSFDGGGVAWEFGVSPQLNCNGQFIAFPEGDLTLTIDDNGTNPSQSVALVYAYVAFYPQEGSF